MALRSRRSFQAFSALVAGALIVVSCARTDAPAVVPPVVVADAGPPPVADRDNDGVPDEDDRCPDDPEDCDGFQDNDGCPEEDNDKDGLPDECDRCPDVPGAPSRGGCPLIFLDVATVRIALFVEFERNGVKGSYAHFPDDLIPIMKEARFKRIGLVGHAQKGEKDAARLAMRRAEVVKKDLVARGVPDSKFELRAAPAGNLESCPAPEDGGAPPICVSLHVVEAEAIQLEWDGARYVDRTPPPPPPPPLECPPPKPRGPGHPCTNSPRN